MFDLNYSSDELDDDEHLDGEIGDSTSAPEPQAPAEAAAPAEASSSVAMPIPPSPPEVAPPPAAPAVPPADVEEADGFVLERSSTSNTGYKGVCKAQTGKKRFQATVSSSGLSLIHI